jgi:hypothetical protein
MPQKQRTRDDQQKVKLGEMAKVRPEKKAQS